jgi:hypothetical protein
MVASSDHTQPESRVPGSSMAIASQTGGSATGSFDLGHGLNEVEGSEHPRREEERESTVVEDDDGISPDDAPELVRDDLNEEV